jgi:hypothetical protein
MDYRGRTQQLTVALDLAVSKSPFTLAIYGAACLTQARNARYNIWEAARGGAALVLMGK